MAKRYKKLQPKLKPLPFIVMGAILAVFILLIVFLRDTPQQRLEKQFNSVGADLASDHVLEEVKLSVVLGKIEKNEKIVVFFGTPTCSVCVQEVGFYNSEFKEAGLKEKLQKIYYVNVTKLTENQTDKFFEDYGVDLTTTPNLLYFENDEVSLSRNDEQFNLEGTKTRGQIHSFFIGVYNKQ